MPSALLPLLCHTLVHFCPAAMTPGIAVTADSGAAWAAGAAPRPPPAGPPPRAAGAGGGVLQVSITDLYRGSAAACRLGPAAGACAVTSAAPNSAANAPESTWVLMCPSLVVSR